MINGESFAGIEPAQTRWRKALMSRGVGLGGSSLLLAMTVGGDVEGMPVIFGV